MNIIKEHWPSFFVLIVGLLITTFRMTGYEVDFYPGKLGDARFNMYMLEHAYQYFITDTSIAENYWSAPFMFPESNVITYSDNLLGTFPLYSIFRLLGAEVVLAFTFWFIALSILNYLSAYFFIKWLLKDRFSAAIGAFIFAFSVALFSQAFHAQTFPRFAIPLAFWTALLFKKQHSPLWFLCTILLVSYQIYCGIYLGFMLIIPIGVLLLSIIIADWKSFSKRVKKIPYTLKIIGSLGLGIVSLIPLIIPYSDRADGLGLKSYEVISGSIPRLRSYFYPTDPALSWDWFNLVNSEGLENYWNHQIFPGGVAWIAAIVVLGIIGYKIYRSTIDFKNANFLLFVTACITFFAFIDIQGFSLYQFVKNIPGFASMQAIQRIINIELLFFGLAAAYLFKRYFAKTKRSMLYFLVIVAVLSIDNYGNQDKFIRTSIEEATDRVDRLSEKLRFIPRGSIVSYEPNQLIDNSIYYQLDAMLATQRMGHFSVNGYSATCPGQFCPFWREPNEKNRIHWLESRGINPHLTIVAH